MNDKTIRIVSDGTPQNTKVYNHQNKEIRGITEIDIKIREKGFAMATLTFERVEFEVLAEIKETK